MAEIKHFKVTTLPGSPVADAFYYIENGDYAEAYLTDSSGVAKYIGNTTMITEIFNSLITDYAPIDSPDFTTVASVDGVEIATIDYVGAAIEGLRFPQSAFTSTDVPRTSEDVLPDDTLLFSAESGANYKVSLELHTTCEATVSFIAKLSSPGDVPPDYLIAQWTAVDDTDGSIIIAERITDIDEVFSATGIQSAFIRVTIVIFNTTEGDYTLSWGADQTVLDSDRTATLLQGSTLTATQI